MVQGVLNNQNIPSIWRGILLLLITIAIVSCNGNRTDANQAWIDSDSIVSAKQDSLEALLDSTMPRGADELFNDFFFNFAGSSRLQSQRMTIDKEHWTYNSFIMEQGYYTPIFDNPEQVYLQNDTNISKAVVEKIFLKLNYIKKYTFHKLKGYWMLTDVTNEKMSESPNGDFLQFYYKFANDQKFQISSLGNPVIFIGPDPDNDFDTIEGEILPETWPAFCPNLPKDILFNIVYNDENGILPNSKLFIINGIANGLEIRLTFNKERPSKKSKSKEWKWKLVQLEQ